MNYKYIKKALSKIGYSVDSTKSLMCGRSKPSFSKAQQLYEKHNIPFEAWIDIKSFLNSCKNDTKKDVPESSSKIIKKAS